MSKKNTMYILEYGNTTIQYGLTYANRETLAIHVNPDTSVEVEAPQGSQFPEIEKRVRRRAAWIVKQQRNFRRYSVEFPPRQYVSGESHRFLGHQYRLKVVQPIDGMEDVRMDREQIFVFTKDKTDHQRTKRLLEGWLRERAREIFTERLETWYPRFERFEVQKPRVAIRNMKSRWGSCTTKGKMTLNFKLIQVHRSLIDYVIVHELCHLVEHNHSAAFYALLSRMMPGWEEKRESLNTFEF